MSTQITNPPKVFISYSWDSPEHKERILELANRLLREGIDCNIDEYEESPSEGWPRWVLNQLDWAEFVIVVCTEQYDRRFRGREEPGKGRGVTWEGAIINQVLYDEHVKSTKFIPVVFSDKDRDNIPSPLRGFTSYNLDTEYEALYRRLTKQPLNPKPSLGSVVELSPREVLLPLLPRERKQDFSNKEPELGQENYTRLRDLLEDEQWREADEETWRLMLRAAGREQEGNLKEKDLKKISCEVLRHIDNLWVEFSAGHFGFRVQKEIWQSPEVDYDLAKFIARVGWGETKIDESGTFWFIFKHIDNLSFNLAAPKGQLPAILGYNSQLRSESISRFIRCGLGNTTTSKAEEKLNSLENPVRDEELRKKLVELLKLSKRTTVLRRETLCDDIGFKNIPQAEMLDAEDFAKQLVRILFERELISSLCKLCKILEDDFPEGRYFNDLKEIKINLNCK